METKDKDLERGEHHELIPISTTSDRILPIVTNSDDGNYDDDGSYYDPTSPNTLSSPLDDASLFDFSSNFGYRRGVNTVVCSPDGTHIATLSQNGVVSLWDFLKPDQNTEMTFCRKPKFSTKTEFKDNSQPSDQHVILAVSVRGEYIALSSVPTEIMKYEELPFRNTSQSQAIIMPAQKGRIQPQELVNETFGIITFLKDRKFVTCDGCLVKVYLHPTDNESRDWKLLYKLDIRLFFQENLTVHWRKCKREENIAEKLIDIFRFGRIFMFDDKDTLSLWHLEADSNHYNLNVGTLMQRFSLPHHYDYIAIAISNNDQLLATVTYSKDPAEMSKLTVYLMESGLVLAQNEFSERQIEMVFLNNDQILTYGPQVDEDGSLYGYKAVLFDAYSGRLLGTFKGEEDVMTLNIFAEMPEHFVVRTPHDGLQFWPVIHNQVSDQLKEVTVVNGGKLGCPESPFIVRAIPKSKKTVAYSIEFFNEANVTTSMCISQWQHATDELRAIFLDNGKRVLIVTSFLIIIFFVGDVEPELQYIWSVPTTRGDVENARRDSATGITRTSNIDAVFLDFIGAESTGVLNAVVHVMPTNSNPSTIPLVLTIALPTVDEDYSSRNCIQNICISLAFIRLKLTKNQFEKDDLVRLSKELVRKTIPKNPGMFTRVSSHVFPLREFVYANWDDIIISIIKEKQYVPCFYNAPENTESALTLSIRLLKGKVVKAFLLYYAEKAQTNPQYMINICPALPYLHFYPDNVSLLMKKISYNPTQPSSLVRQLPTEILPGQYERSSKPKMQTYCLRRQQLPTKDPSRFESVFYKIKCHFKKAIEVVNDWRDMRTLPRSFLATRDVFEGFSGTPKTIKETAEEEKLLRTHPALLCNVPLPGFSSYRVPKGLKGFGRIWNEYISPRSPFSREALHGHDELFAEPVMEAIINFKWERFARERFFILWMFQMIFFILFAVGISVESNSFEERKGILSSVLIIAVVFMLMEIWQLIGQNVDYISIYNLIDLLAYSLPGACGVYAWRDEIDNIPKPLSSFAMMMLWFQFILQLRIIKRFGIFVAITIEIIKEIFYFLILIALIIGAFAHSLHLLLRDVNIHDILPDYNGEISLGPGKEGGSITMEKTEESDSNTFKRLDLALRSVYFFLDGDYGTLEGFRDNRALDVLKVAFSFFTGIILLNMLIAMMAEVYSKTVIDGERAWLRQMATLIAEIEISFMTPSERSSPDLFPSLVYYEAPPETVENYEANLGSSEERNDSFVRENERLLEKAVASMHEQNKQLMLEVVREENEKWVKRMQEWGGYSRMGHRVDTSKRSSGPSLKTEDSII